MTALRLTPPLLAWLGPDDRVDPQARGVRPPSAAEQAARARARPTPLWQALLLAGLLHLWAALLLGNVPPGTAQPGQGVAGALNIRLQAGSGPAREPDAPLLPAPTPTGPPGDAASPRHGGAVRSQPAPAEAPPGAARLGDWAQGPAPAAAAAAAAAATAPAELAPPPAAPPPGSTAWAAATPLPAAAPPPPAAPAPSVAVPSSALATLPPLAPAATPGLLAEPLAPMQPAATPAAVAARELPALPALAEAPSPQLQAAGALERAVQPLLPAAQPAPAALPAPALALPAVPALADGPSPRLAADAPLARAVPQLGAGGAAALGPGPALLPPAGQAAALPGLPALGAPLSAAGPAPAQAGPASGAPDAGAEVGADVATAPSAPASAPRLNLQLPRPRGGELSALGGRGLLPVMPRPPERKPALEEAVESAARPDCRTAHARMGLLAVAPLAADALRREGGCKW